MLSMEDILFWFVAIVTVSCCHGLHQSNKLYHSLDSNGCYHMPDEQKIIYDVDLRAGNHQSRHKRATFQPLRIHIQYDYSLDYLPSQHTSLIKRKVEKAVAFWEDTLMVRRSGPRVKLNRKCLYNEARYMSGTKYCKNGCSQVTKCGDVRVPFQHLQGCIWWNSTTGQYYLPQDSQSGVYNTDFILYVAATPSDKCQVQSTVAFAAHCQQERELDRPVAGYFSICPNSVSTSIHKHEELLYTIKHEILHALGFTAGLYAFYRDENGVPLTLRDANTNKPLFFDSRRGMYLWGERVVRQINRYPWKLKGQIINKTVNMIVTPNVVREVRTHFNCPFLEGAELEDQGINGTALTHWEKRVFENEFMTGTYTQNPIISRISLALMEDTGWYKVKYENAGTLEWGQNLGCDFVTRSCFDWISSRQARNQDIHPFCTTANRGQPVTDCTKNRKAVAICNLAEFPVELPSRYQYFSNIYGVPLSKVKRYGGSVALADYCPYLQEFVWKQGEEIVRGSRCALHHNQAHEQQNFLLESYGTNSKCFNHNSGWNLYTCRNVFTPHSGSGCYEYSCSLETGLSIYVEGIKHRCYYTGQPIVVDYRDRWWKYTGNITCPSCQEICQDEGVRCPPEDRSVYSVYHRPYMSDIPCRAPHIYNIYFIVSCLFVLLFIAFVL